LDRARFLALASAAAVFSFCTTADAAPSQLLNKSISVSMSVSIPAKSTDGTVSTRQRQISRQIYVSSQGRLFVKIFRRARGGASDSAVGPGEGGANLHFAGNKLVGTLAVVSGANQLTISFDPSFQSCTADMIIGTEAGKPRVWKGLNGETFTATGKAVVSGVSCSIRDGNVFAN
jgi:hypothetical protein